MMGTSAQALDDHRAAWATHRKSMLPEIRSMELGPPCSSNNSGLERPWVTLSVVLPEYRRSYADMRVISPGTVGLEDCYLIDL